MLTYRLFDINGNESILKNPLRASFISSNDAPADSLTTVFAVSGTVYDIVSVIVENGNERVFNGFVDTQTTEETKDAIILTINARSLECVLLDNEAAPQTYCVPSMPLIVERHLKPLGFSEYIGDSRSFSGEMTISKGMSEWAVLSMFCSRFLRTTPKIDRYGVIDITGRKSDEILYISESMKNRCISKKIILKRDRLISEISARTYIAGGYEMPFDNPKAKKLGVVRKRYVNTIDSESRTILETMDILTKSNNSYEEIIIELGGCIICGVGAEAVIENVDKKLRVKQINYLLSQKEEKTRIYMEVIDQ